jgi:drug/metabolite transporter (DMT)-like permease
MPYLLAVSLLWAFSFGLIKGRLAGLDSAFVSAARLGLALLVFLPFFRWRYLSAPLAGRLAAIGAVQFGVMYLAYNESFRHLQAHEVALFTLTTPVLVTLLADALDRTFRIRALLAAVLAVAGTTVTVLQGETLKPTLTGLLLVQVSNLAFAAGQIAYKRLRAGQAELNDAGIFALLYGGAFLLTALVAFARLDPAAFVLTSSQSLTLLYLGVLASGAGFFFWNVGATRTPAGTLAVMNNAKIPLAVACSLLFFGEEADLARLAVSLALLAAAVWLAESRPATARNAAS